MRVKNWESKFYKYIEKMSNYPFIWGESDCCHFVNESIYILTGSKFNIPKLNEKDAARYLKSKGGIEKVADSYMTRKDVLYVSRGDVVSANVGNDRIALGLCVGDYLLFKNSKGLTKLPLNSIRKAWSVD